MTHQTLATSQCPDAHAASQYPPQDPKSYSLPGSHLACSSPIPADRITRCDKHPDRETADTQAPIRHRARHVETPPAYLSDCRIARNRFRECPTLSGG